MTTATTTAPSKNVSIDQLAINTIRTLSMDAVQKADSGHPGTPMALAPVAYALWQDELRFDPADAHWANRDRFVLSNGHASMLLYSMIHLAGVQALDHHSGKPLGRLSVTLDDIKQFRQLGSMCPGHPESHLTTGVETTTGPLGQGCATSVGMAMASSWLANRYNKPGFELFSWHTWVICGDGCLMEGISGEAASVAGHLKLANLTWIYDNNHITIEGNTSLAYSDDVATRFKGYGWNALHVTDANDQDALKKAFAAAKACTDRPTIIIVDSHIGYGAPKKQDTAAAHGEPLGEDEIKAAKRFYGWPEDAQFLVPDGVRERFAAGVGARGAKASAQWRALFDAYAAKFPAEAAEIRMMLAGELPKDWDADLPAFKADAKGIASRASGGQVLNAVAKRIPWMVGGAADLAPSTKTLMTFDGARSYGPADHGGRNLHFGIREHAMGAICNGLALSKLRVYGSGFLIFTDYMRGSIRLSSIMQLPVTYIFTHDSIGLGEDGPTHQPIEHVPGLRALPDVLVFRPCDANEVTECWRAVMAHGHNTSIFALSRQNLPTLDRSVCAAASGVQRGGYVLLESGGKDGAKPDVILIGTGSEVHLCLSAHAALAASGVRVRTVSMPCTQLFDRQDAAYRESVLPSSVRARVSVEAAATFGWERYVGLDGETVGMTTFGASAPIKDLLPHFGFTTDAVVTRAKATMARCGVSK